MRNKVERRVSVNTELLVLSGALGVGYAVGSRINDLERARSIALDLKGKFESLLVKIKSITDEQRRLEYLEEAFSLERRVSGIISRNKGRSISDEFKFWKMDHKYEIREAKMLEASFIDIVHRVEKEL